MTEESENLTPEQELNRIGYFRSLNRRRFLAGLGSAGAMAGAAVVLGCNNGYKNVSAVPPVMAAAPQPADILNFALNLEYLESSFYLYATTGSGLSSTDMGSGAGMVSGGAQVTDFTPAMKTIAQQIATDEVAHVELLRTALGSSAVAMPNINLAALGTVNKQAVFLLVARAFEDTGVSAYLGGAGYLAGDVKTLGVAAQILAIEAYHASNIRLNIIQAGAAEISQDKALDSLDVPTSNTNPDGQNQYFCEKGGLAIVRTPQEVLNIVYANPSAGVKSGGFFPNGLNGTIVST